MNITIFKSHIRQFSLSQIFIVLFLGEFILFDYLIAYFNAAFSVELTTSIDEAYC
jgi:hypothetical protein